MFDSQDVSTCRPLILAIALVLLRQPSACGFVFSRWRSSYNTVDEEASGNKEAASHDWSVADQFIKSIFSTKNDHTSNEESQHFEERSLNSFDHLEEHNSDYQNDDEKFETVPVSAKAFFSKVLNLGSSYRDVIRVFLKHSDWLSDDDVDDLIVTHITLHEVHETMVLKSRWPDASWKNTDESENRLVDLYRAYNHLTAMTSDTVMTDCRLPVPEVERVNLLHRHADRIYLPECIVLHRCPGNRACCHDNAVCSVKSSTIVKLFFIELKYSGFTESEEEHYEPLPAVRAFNFVNHTECHCVAAPTTANTRCLPCPSPFVLDDLWEDCGCRCVSEECLDVTRGRTPLGHQEMTCLHRMECQVPVCNFGTFDINTGYCPCGSLDNDCICIQDLGHCQHGSGDIDAGYFHAVYE